MNILSFDIKQLFLYFHHKTKKSKEISYEKLIKGVFAHVSNL